MSLEYLLLVGVTMLIGFGSQAYVNNQLKKYSRVGVSNGLTGTQAALRMLQYYGIYNVGVLAGSAGEDYFDPRNNTITLSPDSYNVATVTSMATACHEVGHACQYAQGYLPMKIRGAIVPVAGFASKYWIILFFAGILLNVMGLVKAAVLVYAAVVLFELVTLPVEFDASRRARTYMAVCGATQAEQEGASKVLTACALTYVAAALASALQLIYLLGVSDN